MTPRAFSESLLNGVMQSIWYNSSEPADTLLLSGPHKQIFSSFTGVGTATLGTTVTSSNPIGRYGDAEGGKVYQAVDIYVSDFGTVKAIPNRFIDVSTAYGAGTANVNGSAAISKTAYLINPSAISIQYLRNSEVLDLAITGDYESKMIVSEFGLQVTNPLQHGSIRDLA